MPLLEAIHEAGRRRLRPIIMTSLTTIFAMVPLLFSFDTVSYTHLDRDGLWKSPSCGEGGVYSS